MIFWLLAGGGERRVRRGDARSMRLGEKKRDTASSSHGGKSIPQIPGTQVPKAGWGGRMMIIFHQSQGSSEHQASPGEQAAGAIQVMLQPKLLHNLAQTPSPSDSLGPGQSRAGWPGVLVPGGAALPSCCETPGCERDALVPPRWQSTS